MEDETVMNSDSAEQTPRESGEERPAIADVGFNRRYPSDREDTPVSSLSEPWEEAVDAASRKRAKPAIKPLPARPIPAPAAPKSLPPLKKKSAAPLPISNLDADTDEGVIQVPPDPDAFAAMPPFGASGSSWPSGATKPVAPSVKREATQKKKAGLLENKPVTGAKHPPRAPNEMTVAAPGELAGMLDERGPAARPELVDDLLSPVALRKEQQATGDREQRRAEMRKSVETTSPEELRNVRRSKTIPPPIRPDDDVEDTGEVLPPQRLEETRAFVESPLLRAQVAPGSSNIIPLPSIEDTLGKDAARPFGQTQVILRLASGKRRLLALIIDAVVVLSIVVVPLVLGVFGEGLSTADWLDPDDISILLVHGQLTIPLAALLFLVVMFSALGHGLTGRSLGKLICGLELVRKKTGTRVGIVRAVLRAFFSLFSLIFGGAGYLWLIVDRRARTFHDYLTGTVVVVAASRTEGPRTEESFVHEPTL